ncbi:MAG: outer membrane lipoprotein-sorting protein [bacterium]|nr:outer membrane lipoprotein-sorting protein [bacterium]
MKTNLSLSISRSTASLAMLLLLLPSVLSAQTAKQIIRKVDKNQLFKTQKFSAKMTIVKGKRKMKKSFSGYGQKKGEKAFMKFTNSEDRGVKYLKMNKELWIYFPDADDIMKISGHMLKQGLMGSDISYEDMLETEHMEKKYTLKLLKKQTINRRPCFVVELTAKVPSATYARQVLYIDRKKYIPLKIEMYARGGRLLKEVSQSKIKKRGRRYIAHRMTIRDMRKRNSKTVVEFKKIKYDIRIPGRVFSKRQLRK